MKTVEAIKAAKKRGALHFAALEGQTEICYYLLEDLKLQIDSKDDDVDTALIHAARRGHTATAKYFIDHGMRTTNLCPLTIAKNTRLLQRFEEAANAFYEGVTIDPEKGCCLFNIFENCGIVKMAMQAIVCCQG
ncbi:hypothetical protein RYX36_032739 [Vicia faba]